MPKYYYNDPLKAVWMAREFQMKFKTSKDQNMYFDGGSDLRTEKDCGIYSGEKYYIHPDCHKMLKPQIGDLLKDEDGKFHLMEGWHGECFIFVITSRNNSENYKIIQRNGKAFFTPEIEE